MIEKLFLEYGYKDFQHKVQSINSKKLAEEFEKNFLKEKFNHVELVGNNIVGVASLKPFTILSKIWRKKTVFLKDFVAKNHDPEVYNSILKKILKKHSKECDFIITKQPIDNSNAINVAMKNGFYYVCSEAIYTAVLDRVTDFKINQKNFKKIRKAKESEVEQIKQLAYDHNKYNRYLLDKHFKREHVGKLYAKVIEQSFKHSSHHVYVYEEQDNICGFITTINNKSLSEKFSQNMGYKYGSLDYITVNENYQQKGIGQALTNYGIYQLKKKGVNVISVKTMSNNYPAIKLLINDQFFLTSENVILHKLIS